MDIKATKVHFRMWQEGDCIALFPEDTGWESRFIGSYQHVGQHGSASPDLIVMLTPATPEQYADLKQELEAQPYAYKLEVLP